MMLYIFWMVMWQEMMLKTANAFGTSATHGARTSKTS